MIKLKSLLNISEEKENNTTETLGTFDSNKSINDEFRVNPWMLGDIKKMLEKANKNLKARNLTELELVIVKEEVVNYQKNEEGSFGDWYKMPVYTIKVVGEIPPIKDYEFIAKIEHDDGGNIINMNPKSSVEKLPDEYKSFNQKCDICHTNRERLNTFIIKKVDENKLITAGSSCLKKFMPLDVVKAFVDYSIKLNDIRNVLVDYERNLYNSDDFGYGEGGGRSKIYYGPEEIMFYICIAYLNNNKIYISKAKSIETNKISTIDIAKGIMNGLMSRSESLKREYNDIVKKYKTEAQELSNKVLNWADQQDFEEMAKQNPKMDSYFHNLGVLIKRNFLEDKHLGYFSSILGLYLRENSNKEESHIQKEYYGNIGEKIVDIPVELVFLTSYDTAYDIVFLYNFTDGKHNFVYKGNPLNLQKGDKILLSGTIKSHQEYKGTKQTIIQRPKIKKIGE